MLWKTSKSEPESTTEFNNLARRVEDRRGKEWYEWMVYVDEDNDLLDSIDSVEYLLHPSYPLRSVMSPIATVYSHYVGRVGVSSIFRSLSSSRMDEERTLSTSWISRSHGMLTW